MFVVVLKQHFSTLDFQVGEVGSALLLLQNSLGVAGRHAIVTSTTYMFLTTCRTCW